MKIEIISSFLWTKYGMTRYCMSFIHYHNYAYPAGPNIYEFLFFWSVPIWYKCLFSQLYIKSYLKANAPCPLYLKPSWNAPLCSIEVVFSSTWLFLTLSTSNIEDLSHLVQNSSNPNHYCKKIPFWTSSKTDRNG